MAAELEFPIDGREVPGEATTPGGPALRTGVAVHDAPRLTHVAVPGSPIPIVTPAASGARGPITVVPVAHPLGGRPGSDLDGNAVRSVDRAAALLIALGDVAGDAGVTELARRLGLHKSTASRLLATLERRGLVEQDDETGRYRLGLAILRLAERAEETLDLRGIARADMERLARETRETVGLVTLDGDAAMTVAQVDGPNMVACADWTGRTVSLHGLAAGKVMLATYAERDVLRLVKQGLEARTERTITRLEPLLEELARVRRRDHATSFGEWEPGVNGIAVPVRDRRGRIVAALTVWGAAYRVTPARVPDLVACARAAAAAISVRLGGTPA
jgi:IclR family transcriptional regulator, acetate operon repressor